MIIDTVVFDMGGTIEEVTYDEKIRLEASRQLLDYLGSLSVKLDISYQQFASVLKYRFNEYKNWSVETMIEAKPHEIWNNWLLKDFNVDRKKIIEISEPLSVFWETRFYKRKCRSDAAETLDELCKRGYRLGIISNTTSQTQVFSTLKEYGIDRYFDCVCLSSISGCRKPDTLMFNEVIEKMNSSPDRAVYVGDQVARDIVGSKAAGYALSILIESFFTNISDASISQELGKIDYTVRSLKEIIDILVKVNS